MKTSITSFSDSDIVIKNKILDIIGSVSIPERKRVFNRISKNSHIFNTYFEENIPSWKATEEIPTILVISANPPSLCVFIYPQEWQVSSKIFSWDKYDGDTWDTTDRLVCPFDIPLPPFWEALTYDRSGGIISENVVIGTIFDDQE